MYHLLLFRFKFFENSKNLGIGLVPDIDKSIKRKLSKISGKFKYLTRPTKRVGQQNIGVSGRSVKRSPQHQKPKGCIRHSTSHLNIGWDLYVQRWRKSHSSSTCAFPEDNSRRPAYYNAYSRKTALHCRGLWLLLKNTSPRVRMAFFQHIFQNHGALQR